MSQTKQKTITIKPVFGNSNQRRIFYWTVCYHGKVLHSSPSIYNPSDEISYYRDMVNWCKNNNATHYKVWLTDTKYPITA